MTAPSPALLRRQDLGDAVVLTFTEPRLLDEEKIKALGEQLLQAASQSGDKTLLLRMDQVEYVSSHMVAKLLAVHQRVQALGGKLVLADVPPRIFATLQTANLDKVFDVRPLRGDHRARGPADGGTDSGATMPLG